MRVQNRGEERGGDCRAPFYPLDLSIRGFWYLRGQWGGGPRTNPGGYRGTAAVYVRFRLKWPVMFLFLTVLGSV